MKSSVLGFLKNVLTGNVRFSSSPRLLARFTAGAGAGEELKIGDGLTIEGDTLKATGGITSITSSQISDATSDPPGSEAAGKAVLFNSVGGLKARRQLSVASAGEAMTVTVVCESNSPSFRFTKLVPPLGAVMSHLSVPEASLGYDWSMPAATGTVGILPPFADAAAANAVVSVGDAWWDTTLNKARVRLS